MDTFTRSNSQRKLCLATVALIVFLCSFFKIADLDFWWHLKTGQIILQQKQFQFHEIYSFTASGRPYVDHEWLFQVFIYLSYLLGGIRGVILLKCAILTLLYGIIANFLIKKGLSPWMVITLALLSIAGGRNRFIERPEIFTELFLVTTYVCLNRYLERKRWVDLVFLLPVFILWANIHAAVILGIVLLCIFIAGLLLEQLAVKWNYPVFYNANMEQITTLIITLIACTLATGINPVGYTVLMVPFQLTGIIESGLLNNQEWQQPTFIHLPFFYANLVITFAIFLINARRTHFVHLLIAAFLGYISLKYVRNIALFSIFMPLLVWPYLLSIQWKKVLIPVCLCIGFWLFRFSPFQFGAGIAPYFPQKIVQYTKANNLQGHMLNSYAFGGYLIWTLYPERKIFIDGRNEVFLPLLKEIVAVRTDNRLWTRFLEKYQIEYALLNYWDQLEQLTTFDASNRPVVTYAPFSSTHFPRSRWALVYWDDAGMIYVKRNGINGSLANREYTSVFPEGASYMQMLVQGKQIDRGKALAEIQRKLKEDPECKRAQNLLQQISN